MGRPPGEIARIIGQAVLAGGKAEDIADGGRGGEGDQGPAPVMEGEHEGGKAVARQPCQQALQGCR